MSYFKEKCKHAYKCYKRGLPRRKVYAAVEKEDKFLVLKGRRDSRFKYCLPGGGIEKKEDVVTAIKRECLEELNAKVEFEKTLGKIHDKSKWEYKGKEFYVDDEMEIVHVKFVEYGDNFRFGIAGEFDSQDVIAEISKEEMIESVAEFVKYGIKF